MIFVRCYLGCGNEFSLSLGGSYGVFEFFWRRSGFRFAFGRWRVFFFAFFFAFSRWRAFRAAGW
jgi:hypothetical protein